MPPKINKSLAKMAKDLKKQLKNTIGTSVPNHTEGCQLSLKNPVDFCIILGLLKFLTGFMKEPKNHGKHAQRSCNRCSLVL